MITDIIGTIQKGFISPFKNQNMLYQLKSDIKNKYGLNIINIKPLTGGCVHLTYLLLTSCKKKYVLRIYRNRTEEQVQLEAELLDTLSLNTELKDHIAAMVADKFGQKIGKSKDYLYCLFNYIENHPIENLNDHLLQSMLAITRRVHEIGSEVFELFQSRKLQNPSEIAESLAHLFSQNLITETMYKNLTDIIKIYYKALNNYKTLTVLHCDIHDTNLLINKTNDSLVMIDFDDFRVGPHIIDLVVIVRELCLNDDYFDILLTKKILREYNAKHSTPLNFQADDFVILILYDLVRIFTNNLVRHSNQSKDNINYICNDVETFKTYACYSTYNKIKMIQSNFTEILECLAPLNTALTI